ncbi:MAG TPA: sugar ABC transporter substrate-binding protein [Anaerolineae bacterium]
MKRTQFVLVTMLMVVAMLLSACGPAATPAAAPAATQAPAAAPAATKAPAAAPAATQAPAAAPAASGFDWMSHKGEKLRVAMVKQPGADFIASNIDEFKKLTGIDVTYEVLPEDQFRQKTTVEFAAGTSDVDVFLSMVQQEGIKYESAGWYEDIEKLANNPKLTDPNFDIKDFTTSGLSIARLPNGKLIGLPIYNEFGALMYNKALFDKAKIAYPPKTLAEMEAAAKALTDKANGVYGFCGRGKGAAGTSQFSSVMFSSGSEWVTNGKPNLTDQKWLDAMTWYGNLIKNYGPPGATSMTWNQCQDLLVQGKAAMWLDASIFFANVVDPAQSKIADTAAIAMVPAGAAGQVPYVGGWHLSLYSGSKHKEAGWLFIQWALGKPMVLKAQLNNITTGRTSAWNSAEYKAANKHPDLTESFLAAMKQGNPAWNPPVLAVSEARDDIGVVLVTAIEGGDIKAAATKANDQLQKLLDATPKLK